MFTAIRNLVDSARIALTFSAFEASARVAYASKAEARFSTNEERMILDKELSALNAEAQQRFGDLIDLNTAKLRDVTQTVVDAEHKLSYFCRDYRFELNQAYEPLNEARTSRKNCCEELARAHDKLASAKRSLDAWYSGAEGNWFGNGGKRLPDNSFFGQDLADRDRYKQDRDAAGSLVHQLHEQRNSIDSEIGRLKEKVASIKADRQSMHDLRSQGFDRQFLERVSSNGKSEEALLDAEVGKLKARKLAFLTQERIRRGIPELEDRIAKIESRKRVYLAEFDSLDSKLRRQAVHRAEWKLKHAR